MASIDDAVEALTDPRNLSELGDSRDERRFAVKQKQVIARLREGGAGKAEARTLALQAVEKVGGEVSRARSAAVRWSATPSRRRRGSSRSTLSAGSCGARCPAPSG